MVTPLAIFHLSTVVIITCNVFFFLFFFWAPPSFGGGIPLVARDNGATAAELVRLQIRRWQGGRS